VVTAEVPDRTAEQCLSTVLRLIILAASATVAYLLLSASAAHANDKPVAPGLGNVTAGLSPILHSGVPDPGRSQDGGSPAAGRTSTVDRTRSLVSRAGKAAGHPTPPAGRHTVTRISRNAERVRVSVRAKRTGQLQTAKRVPVPLHSQHTRRQPPAKQVTPSSAGKALRTLPAPGKPRTGVNLGETQLRTATPATTTLRPTARLTTTLNTVTPVTTALQTVTAPVKAALQPLTKPAAAVLRSVTAPVGTTFRPVSPATPTPVITGSAPGPVVNTAWDRSMASASLAAPPVGSPVRATTTKAVSATRTAQQAPEAADKGHDTSRPCARAGQAPPSSSPAPAKAVESHGAAPGALRRTVPWSPAPQPVQLALASSSATAGVNTAPGAWATTSGAWLPTPALLGTVATDSMHRQGRGLSRAPLPG
jgi:hypothetical protein